MRLTVFAWCNASVVDAFLLDWAMDQTWFSASMSEQQFEALRLVVRPLVQAHPGFMSDAPKAIPQQPKVTASLVDDVGAEPDSAATADAVGNSSIDEPQTDAEDDPDLEATCRNLEAALTSATDAARRVTETIEDGRPPSTDDLTELNGLSAAFERAKSLFAKAGIETKRFGLQELSRTAREYRATRDRDRALRETLSPLVAITCLPNSAVAPTVDVVHTLVGGLLETSKWSEAERREAVALAALARLIDLQGRGETLAEILDLQQEVVRTLPTCAPAAVMASELVLPAPSYGHADSALTRPGEEGTGRAGPTSRSKKPENNRGGVDSSVGTSSSTTGHVVPGRPDPVAGAVGAAAPAETKEARPAGPLSPRSAGIAPEQRPVDLPTEIPDDVDAPQPAGEPETADPQEPVEGMPGDRPAVSLSIVTRAAKTASTVTRPADETAKSPTAVNSGLVEQNVGQQVDADDTTVECALAKLIEQRRFGLAHHVARAAGCPASQVNALRLAGAARHLTSAISQDARVVANLLTQQSSYAGPDAEGSELLLFPALLRAALVTGDHLAGAQLKALAQRLPVALAEVATAVGDRALSGALMLSSPLAVFADASETEERLRELREQGESLLMPPSLRFVRAFEMAKQWLAPEGGLLGSMLRAVAEDDRATLETVRQQAERLSKLSEINGEIDRLDRRHRGPSGKPLQGAGRQDLVHLVERSVSLAQEWCLAVGDARRNARSHVNRADKEISSLRQSMLARQGDVLMELERMATRPDAVVAASASAAHAAMGELFGLLSGGVRNGSPAGMSDPDIVLDVELLKVCDAVDEQQPLDRLLLAIDRDWRVGLEERLGHDALIAARTIVELDACDELPGRAGSGGAGLRTLADIEEWAAGRRDALRARHGELVADLHAAHVDGAVTEDQDLSLQESLAAARARLDDPNHVDLLDVRRALDRVSGHLPVYRREAADRIRARLDALETTKEQRSQVLRHLGTGGLATAADLVYFLEIGEEVPEIESVEFHLTEFFPAVPVGLPKGIDDEIIALIRSGGRHPDVPILDYGQLSSDEAALAADALHEWRELGAAEPKDRSGVDVEVRLLSALKLLGYDAKSARSLADLSPQRREYRFFEATGVEVNGRAMVPEFGSQIEEQGGNLRVLVLWGRPPAKVVMSRASRDPSETSLLVVYFGTLSREARAELAAGSHRLQPLLVVDDAALAYLAARGNRQVSTATQILLPFSGVNPYIREKRGRIGGEMFYGRDAERGSIIKPGGTQVIFGGRGLGKSALLSDAGARFTRQRLGYHLSIYVNLDQENIGKGSSLGPEILWSVLSNELTSTQVLGRQQGRKAPQDDFKRVHEGVCGWLEKDSRRRLLILLDECDRFFEADAPRFDQTKKLKKLGDDTMDRAKVVFAGLHSVQRFSKLASNGPFGHLAQTPKVIGPLAPQVAADLLLKPTGALGFKIDDVDLVNRVLGYCSYQPFLLQMFGHRLVEVMHRKRARPGAEGPPYTVELDDIEAVESDTELRAGISAAFKDTLSLDHRYDVIANALAYHARQHGLEVRLTDAELREECERWWREGFERLDSEGFRCYLSEMVGLGVLAPNHDGRGWHLRGPNALRMIGTSHEVEARLLRAERDCKLEASIVVEGRPELSDGRPAPLTITQLDDLLGNRANQTRVVLGTAATGVTDVEATLRAVPARISDWKLPPVGRPSVYKQELKGGRPGERRVVISDLARYATKPHACRDAVDLAEAYLPSTPGVTRAVVLITDPRQLDLWRSLLMGEEQTSATPVVLRRHDRRSLHDWAQRQKAEVFSTDERLRRLYALTGGWPILVDLTHQLYGELGDAEQVLQRLADLPADRGKVREFLDATGIRTDPVLMTGYQSVARVFGDELLDPEIAVAAIDEQMGDEEEARWIFTCLDALQVFDHEEGQLRLEPLLRQCVELVV
ncbi:hypothetical protein [Streptomyces sp. NPDC050560]|uniref:hypothetical protein n=1 Tax=Streptomyces sp. NPDC050560 TaxID=3365630 RepID=UPI0037BBD498